MNTHHIYDDCPFAEGRHVGYFVAKSLYHAALYWKQRAEAAERELAFRWRVAHGAPGSTEP